jgi:hypothetical protein
MATKVEERIPLAVVATKMFVLFLPLIIATVIFGSHAP